MLQSWNLIGGCKLQINKGFKGKKSLSCNQSVSNHIENKTGEEGVTVFVVDHILWIFFTKHGAFVKLYNCTPIDNVHVYILPLMTGFRCS